MTADDRIDEANQITTDAAQAALDPWAERVVSQPPPQLDPRRVALRTPGHCGRGECRCTHTEGCEFGWVEMPAYTDPVTKQTYQPVQPCPVCRPESYARLREESRNDGRRVGRRRS